MKKYGESLSHFTYVPLVNFNWADDVIKRSSQVRIENTRIGVHP